MVLCPQSGTSAQADPSPQQVFNKDRKNERVRTGQSGGGGRGADQKWLCSVPWGCQGPAWGLQGQRPHLGSREGKD